MNQYSRWGPLRHRVASFKLKVEKYKVYIALGVGFAIGTYFDAGTYF